MVVILYSCTASQFVTALPGAFPAVICCGSDWGLMCVRATSSSYRLADEPPSQAVATEAGEACSMVRGEPSSQ